MSSSREQIQKIRCEGSQSSQSSELMREVLELSGGDLDEWDLEALTWERQVSKIYDEGKVYVLVACGRLSSQEFWQLS